MSHRAPLGQTTLLPAAILAAALAAAPTGAPIAHAQFAFVSTAAVSSTRAADGEWQFSGFNAADAEMSWGFSSPRPPFNRAMLARAIDRLAMDDAQRQTAQSVFDSFEQEYLSIWLEHTETNSDSRSQSMMQQDWMEFQRRTEEAAEKHRNRMKSLVDAFMLDFELMLTPEQAQTWAAIEQDKSRGEHLAMATDGRVSPVDLSVVIDGLDLADADKHPLAPIIERYHADIDAALSPAIRHAERVSTLAREAQALTIDMQKLYQEESPDMTKIEELQARQAERNNAARDAALELRRMYDAVLTVQRRATDELRAALPSAAHEKYDKATLQRVVDGWDWSSYSRFQIATQTLLNLEQARAMMDFQMAAMTDSMEGQQGEMMREMALMMRRAKPLTQEQKRAVEQLLARHKQQTEDLEKSARERRRAAAEAQSERTMQIRVPGGSISLYKASDDGSWGGYPGMDELDKDAASKRATLEQQSMDELRGMLDFYQRALIANY